MDEEKKFWDNPEWLSGSRMLVNKLIAFSNNSKTALIMRHSQRNEPSPWEINGNMELTPEGIKSAFIFGKKLPMSKPIKIYHSPVTRCKETAEQIHKGFENIGGNSEFVGESNILLKLGIDKITFIEELKKLPIHTIINRWIAGLYSPEKWPSWQSYCLKAAIFIWNELAKLPDNTLAIFITHDVHLMLLRFGWFGLPINDKWISYLNGFAFSFENDKIKLLDSGKVESIEIPYWWNNTNK